MGAARAPSALCRGGCDLANVGDARRTLLVQRAEDLAGWTEGSPERAEPASAVDVIEARGKALAAWHSDKRQKR
jgi:hypothetical protein